MPQALHHDDVVAMLARYGNRSPSAVGEHIDSLELAWLVHQVEERYGAALELSDDELGRILTVSDAVDVLGRAVEGLTP